MKAANGTNKYEGTPEEPEKLQLTEEEMGMICSGEKAESLLQCPYCGSTFPNSTTLARHKALCPENPDKKTRTTR